MAYRKRLHVGLDLGLEGLHGLLDPARDSLRVLVDQALSAGSICCLPSLSFRHLGPPQAFLEMN